VFADSAQNAEAIMKLLYIISSYKYADQLVRLISRLNTRNAYFYVHVDKKTSGEVYDRMVHGVRQFNNVYFLDRHKCHWGNFGHILATIKGLSAATESSIDFDYAILLTGQDYPIKTNTYIEEFFEQNNGKQFMSYVPIPCDPRYGWQNENGGADRIERWSFRLCGRWLHIPWATTCRSSPWDYFSNRLASLIPRRTFPANITPYGGESYWCITRECAQYIIDYTKKNPEFVKYFRSVFIPDEIFFHTIIMNSHFKENVVNNNLRCINWSSRGPDGSLPKIWGERDFPALSASTALFARKFDQTLDPNILNLIDTKLLTTSSYLRNSFSPQYDSSSAPW
jgi:hypothetical protein